MYSKKPYTKAVDIWSLGVILYVMTTGSFPFEGDTLQILSRKILTKNPSFPAQVSNEMKQLIIGLLQKDPDQRLTIEEILETPIVKNFLSQNPFKTTKATKSMSEEERAALVHSLNDEETLIPLTGFNPSVSSSSPRFSLLGDPSEVTKKLFQTGKFKPKSNKPGARRHISLNGCKSTSTLESLHS